MEQVPFSFFSAKLKKKPVDIYTVITTVCVYLTKYSWLKIGNENMYSFPSSKLTKSMDAHFLSAHTENLT
jgi:hypothetical protein